MEQEKRKLAKRVKKMKLDDNDGSDEDLDSRKKIPKTSYEIFGTLESFKFSDISKEPKKQQNTKRPLVLFADVNYDETKVICGLSNDQLKLVDPQQLTHSISTATTPWRHHGLSCLRCSKTNPSLFFASSSKEGSVFQWDIREESRKAVLKFHSIEKEVGEQTGGSVKKPKPILSFDVSNDDQIICGGTEMVDEDSYLLFWDARSPKLLGAYWESHSDDITAVKFSSDNSHTVASGSTDGLLNVFDLHESTEDDALQFSFNTESSVDSIEWGMVENEEDLESGRLLPTLACITHTNELQFYDIVSGDRIASYSRKRIAESMKESNPEDVHLTGCYKIDNSGCLGLLVSSLSGGNSQLLSTQLNDIKLRGIFSDQSKSSVIQTATRFSSTNKWLTFDDDGNGKLWEREPNSGSR